jgi:VWFA-related protein
MLAVAASPLAAHIGPQQTPPSSTQPPQTPPGPRPTFRSAVDRVGLTAVVRKPNGQPVMNLKQTDFELLDNGQPREILEFRSDPTPATLALLADMSGSMEVAQKREATKAAAAQVVAQLNAGEDQVGLYAFDTRLREVQPLGPAPGQVLQGLENLKGFGQTSLYDAIGEAARRLLEQGRTHRAVVALTDGAENSSRMTAAEVSRLASEIDVPVYIIVVISPNFREGLTIADDKEAYDTIAASALGSLARWTGGEIFLASSPAQTNLAARQIVNELRHQYFISFAPDTSRPGWHPIDLRTRQKSLLVRSRSGYVAQSRPGILNSGSNH